MLNLHLCYNHFTTNCFIFALIKFKSFKMVSLITYLGMVGPWQIIVILAVVLLLFGGKKIPELMKGLGSGIKEFKDATKEENAKKEENKDTNSENLNK